jgi:hypothetical protein
VIDLIERQGEWLGRWIDDYDAVLTELRDARTPDLGSVPGADTLAQARRCSTASTTPAARRENAAVTPRS